MHLETAPSTTLAELLDILLARLPQLTAPSVSHGARQLYARGIFEEETRPNLALTLAGLLREGEAPPPQSALLIVNDKRLAGPLRIRLALIEPM
jgi:hypothetical protein